MANASSIIEVKNLTKMFNKFTAVDGISFDVKKGEIFRIEPQRQLRIYECKDYPKKGRGN